MSSPSVVIEKNSELKYYLTEQVGGCLCLFRTHVSRTSMFAPCRHDIWLLRDHGTGEWELHCRIDVDTLPSSVASFTRYGNRIKPLAIVDGGRLIFFIQTLFKNSRVPSFELYAYNPLTCEMESLLDRKDLVANYSMFLRHAALYEESVASPGQPHKDITSAMSLVLRLLSFKTLSRLKLVCRSWCVMIDNRDFRGDRNTHTCCFYRDYFSMASLFRNKAYHLLIIIN